MTIDLLIDRDYFTIAVSAHPAQVEESLAERGCLAVFDDRFKVIGILTYKDIYVYRHYNLSLIDLQKPLLAPRSSVKRAILLMKQSGNTVLPVYSGDRFIGIVSLIDLAEYLAG